MVNSVAQSWWMDIIRGIFSFIDMIVYTLLGVVYEIFYSVATANFVQGETIADFFNRVQLILGVIVMFKLVISLFNGILNPDSLSDAKKGVSSILKRVIMVLIMIMLLVPLNIPGTVSSADVEGNGQSSWNARMNENGILFGTLFELQSRLLSDDTISRLVLGESNSGFSTTPSDDPLDATQDFIDDTFGINRDYKDYAKDFAMDILKCFITINPNDDGEDIDPNEYDEDRVCSVESNSDVEEAYDVYNSRSTPAYELLRLVNVDCDDGDLNIFWIGDENYYAFSYSFILSTVVGVFFIIVILSFTVDAAIRLFKLTILRLISPIPVLSYIDPKTESTFQNWVKVVGTTYADLFIRLGIVSFILFFVREFAENGFGLVMPGGFLVKIMSTLFIMLGLVLFAREAPKFILDTLGIKQTKGLFSGLAGIAGLTSSFRSGFAASRASARSNVDPAHPETHAMRNRMKALGAGLVAGAGGAGNAYKGYTSAQDHRWRSAMDPVNRANAVRMQNGEAGSTLMGRVRSQVATDWFGDSPYDKTSREIEAIKSTKKQIEEENGALNRKIDGLGKIKQMGEEKAFDKNAVFSHIDSTTGNRIKSGFRDFKTALDAAKARGDSYLWFESTDAAGNSTMTTMSMEEALANLKNFQEAAGREYIQHSDMYNGGSIDQGIKNVADEVNFTIDSRLTADQFADAFKQAKITAVNDIHANNYGGTKSDGQVISVDDAYYSLAQRQSSLEELQVQQAANLRRNDVSRGMK